MPKVYCTNEPSRELEVSEEEVIHLRQLGLLIEDAPEPVRVAKAPRTSTKSSPELENKE